MSDHDYNADEGVAADGEWETDDDWEITKGIDASGICTVASWHYKGAVAVRIGYVKCGYCQRSQVRPDDGQCVGCGAPTPHDLETV